MKTPPPPGTEPNIVVLLAEKAENGRCSDTLLLTAWGAMFDKGTVFADIGRAKRWPGKIGIAALAMTPRAFWLQLLLITERLEIEILERVLDCSAPEAWDERVHSELWFVPGVAVCQQSMTERSGPVDCEDCLFYLKRGYDILGRQI